jgi:hypothetical protein
LACASCDLGHPSVRYLPSCRTKGFPAPANFESKLSVRDLMWSAKTLKLYECFHTTRCRNEEDALVILTTEKSFNLMCEVRL